MDTNNSSGPKKTGALKPFLLNMKCTMSSSLVVASILSGILPCIKAMKINTVHLNHPRNTLHILTVFFISDLSGYGKITRKMDYIVISEHKTT